MSKVNEMVYQGLVAILKAGKKAVVAKKTAADKLNGIYASGMETASKCSSFEEATDTFEALCADVSKNVDGLGVAIGAQPRKEATKAGETHKLPEALSTLKSAVLFAFENGIALHDKEGKLISFTALRKMRSEILQQKREGEALAVRKSLTGIQLARVEAVEALARVATLIQGSADEAQCHAVIAWAASMQAKPVQPAKPADKPVRKSRAKAADVAADLAKAA